jgi:hypothetical protein
MAFNAIFENVYGLLYNDPSLVPGILGARVPQNLRIFRASPATMQLLSTYEPNQPAEGWCVIEEPLPALRSRNDQVQTNHEYLALNFHVFGTTYSVTHQVLDVLDTFFHWSVAQQRDVQWGDRFLLFTRRTHEIDQYEQASKMYHKLIAYYLELVLEEDAA